MPTRRTRRSREIAEHRINTAALEAWKAGDWMALHLALGLKPWQPSPFDVDRRAPEPDGTAWAQSWPMVAGLRAELVRVAGAPGRAH